MSSESKASGAARMGASGIKYGFSAAGMGIAGVFYWIFKILYYIVKFGKWIAGVVVFLYLLSNSAYEWKGGTWKDLDFNCFKTGLSYAPEYLKAKGAVHDMILWAVLIIVAIIALGFIQLLLHKIFLKIEDEYNFCAISARSAKEEYRDAEVIAAYGQNKDLRVEDTRKQIGDRYVER